MVKMTIGLAYSGRIQHFLQIWMNNLIDDISMLEMKPELIIVNNSNVELNCDVYAKYFSDIVIIKGKPPIIYKNATDKKNGVSRLLAKTYNDILQIASGDIIHLREDDITSTENSFKLILTELLQSDNTVIGVSGLYLNRELNPDEMEIDNEKKQHSIYIDYIGTGYVMFWKHLSPKYVARYNNIKTHDWCWSEKVSEHNLKIKLVPSANVLHWIDMNNNIQHTNQIISSMTTFCKNKIK